MVADGGDGSGGEEDDMETDMYDWRKKGQIQDIYVAQRWEARRSCLSTREKVRRGLTRWFL